MSEETPRELTRLEHEVLRVTSVHDGTATTRLLAMQCAAARQAIASVAARLCRDGLLTKGMLGSQVAYGITEAGRGAVGPPRTRSAFLLVEVDGDRAADIAEQIEQGTDGVRRVEEHGGGCCCKNCPWGGNHGWA